MTKPSNDSFFHRVYDVVRQIPYGHVTTYGHIARAIGSPGAARMVGWAMNASHTLDDVPAHRVVNRNGMLTGKAHFETPDLMQQLLENEGVKVVDNCITNFQEVLWTPPVGEND